MVERIVITDPKLKAREEAAIADLNALASDGVIECLDAKDKSLGKRLSKLYPRLGYETRKDMIEAFGFTLSGRTGRPVSVDPAQFVDEICALYSERAPFASNKEFESLLKEEHPELASKLKTVKNNAKYVFGRSYGAELDARGILGKPSFDDDVVRAALDELVASHAGSDEKPKTINVLFRAHPEYEPMRSAMEGLVWAQHGCTLGEHLVSLGVVAPPKAPLRKVSEDELEKAISDIKRRQAGMKNDRLPKNIAALIEMYPEHAEILQTAQKRKMLSASRAKAEGIVKAGEKVLRERRNLLIERSIRNASLPELEAVWRSKGLPQFVDASMREAWFLPSGIVTIDIGEGVEVGETLHAICVPTSDESDASIRRFLKGLKLTEAEREQVFIEEYDGYSYVQVKLRKTEELQPETLAYALWKAGAFTDADLKLTDEWRTRYAWVLGRACPSPRNEIDGTSPVKKPAPEMAASEGADDTAGREAPAGKGRKKRRYTDIFVIAGSREDVRDAETVISHDYEDSSHWKTHFGGTGTSELKKCDDVYVVVYSHRSCEYRNNKDCLRVSGYLPNGKCGFAYLEAAEDKDQIITDVHAIAGHPKGHSQGRKLTVDCEKPLKKLWDERSRIISAGMPGEKDLVKFAYKYAVVEWAGYDSLGKSGAITEASLAKGLSKPSFVDDFEEIDYRDLEDR